MMMMMVMMGMMMMMMMVMETDVEVGVFRRKKEAQEAKVIWYNLAEASF